MKVFAFRNIIWKCMAWFMIVFCALASVISIYSTASTIKELKRIGLTEEFGVFVAPAVSYATFVLSFVALLCQWKKLRLLIRDISCEINMVDARIENRLLIKTIICLIAFLICNCVDVGSKLKITIPMWTYMYHSSWPNFMCFGCNFTAWNENVAKVFFFTLSTLHGPSCTAIKCFQVMLYCFLSMALANITQQTLSHLGPSLERGSLQNLTTLRRRFHGIRKLVDRLNGLFKNVVLFWLASTLLTTCRNVTEFMSDLLNPQQTVVYHRSAYLWITCLVDLVLLLSLIWVASRLHEECNKVYNYLPYLGDTASLESQGSKELLIFYQELSSRKIALQAGSCLVITKNLLLSFFGLAVTYTIVFIQFKPRLISKINETHSNGTRVQ